MQFHVTDRVRQHTVMLLTKGDSYQDIMLLRNRSIVECNNSNDLLKELCFRLASLLLRW